MEKVDKKLNVSMGNDHNRFSSKDSKYSVIENIRDISSVRLHKCLCYCLHRPRMNRCLSVCLSCGQP